MTDIDDLVQRKLESLDKQGIGDLRAYVERAVRARFDNPMMGAVRGSEALVNSFTTVDRDSPIEHTPPRVGLTIDGVQYDPEDVTRFNGQPLHYVVHDDRDGVRLTATTDGTGLKAALASHVAAKTLGLQTTPVIEPTGWGVCTTWTYDPVNGWSQTFGVCWDDDEPTGGGGGGGSEPTPEPKPWDVPYTSLKMFSDIDFAGDWFWLDQGWGWPNLLKVPRDKGIFGSDDWNDKISSVTATANPVTYYEHINFGGSTLNIRAAQIQNKYRDLHILGWGDRISSVNHW